MTFTNVFLPVLQGWQTFLRVRIKSAACASKALINLFISYPCMPFGSLHSILLFFSYTFYLTKRKKIWNKRHFKIAFRKVLKSFMKKCEILQWLCKFGSLKFWWTVWIPCAQKICTSATLGTCAMGSPPLLYFHWFKFDV